MRKMAGDVHERLIWVHEPLPPTFGEIDWISNCSEVVMFPAMSMIVAATPGLTAFSARPVVVATL